MSIEVLTDAGAVSTGTHLLEVTINTPRGRSAEYSQMAVAKEGKIELKLESAVEAILGAGKVSGVRLKDLKTGQTLWAARDVPAGQASWADGRLYTASDTDTAGLVETSAAGGKLVGRFSECNWTTISPGVSSSLMMMGSYRGRERKRWSLDSSRW